MLHTILDYIKTDIEAISWIERYGGLATPLTIQRDEEDGVVTKTIPMSRYISDTVCESESDRYFYLVPDDSKKSVVYFEQKGNLSFSVPDNSTRTKYRNTMKAIVPLGLTCWINHAAIGSTDQSNTPLLALELYSLLDGMRKKNLTLDLPIYGLKFFVTSGIQKPNLFSGYSYAQDPSLFMYPYDGFGFELSLEFYIKKSCLQAFEVKPAIDCPNPDITILEALTGANLGGLNDEDLTGL